jgi:hypothetical protein
MFKSLLYTSGFLPILPLILIILNKDDIHIHSHINKACKTYILLFIIFILLYLMVSSSYFNNNIAVVITIINIIILKIIIIKK